MFLASHELPLVEVTEPWPENSDALWTTSLSTAHGAIYRPLYTTREQLHAPLKSWKDNKKEET
jgi:hypothetical protein